MIANDRQYQQTRKKTVELERLLAAVHEGTAGDHGFRDLQADALQGQLDDLRVEVAEYDALRSGAMTTFESSTLSGLADALIKARIARG
jgi:HTH-type transcriptional regulator / antitoxin HigA